ncbi:hypothetical protein [Hirschia litorea]|uniref:Uncharacterized protein n=1 Tax=Hirschia litorea TaxID=1199156 RepID=A0ABW2ILU2_9PROT
MKNRSKTKPLDAQQIDEKNRQRGYDEVTPEDAVQVDRGVFRDDGQPKPSSPYARKMERSDKSVKTPDDERHPNTPDTVEENVYDDIKAKFHPALLSTD